MRALSIVVFVGLLAGAAQAADDRLSVHINQSFDCLPLGELVPKLGGLAGVKMVAGKEVADEMVFLCVRDRPLSEVMNRLADSLDMTWFEEGDKEHPRYTFKPTAEQERQTERKILAAKMAGVNRAREDIAKYAKCLEVPEQIREVAVNDWLASGNNRPWHADPASYYAMLRFQDTRLFVKVLSAWSDKDWQHLATTGTVTCRFHPEKGEMRLDPKFLDDVKNWQGQMKAAQSEPFDPYNRPGSLLDTADEQHKQFDPDNIGDLRINFIFDHGQSLACYAAVMGKNGRTLFYSVGRRIGSAFSAPDAPICSTDPVFALPFSPSRKVAELHDKDRFGREYEKRMWSDPKPPFLEPLNLFNGPLLTEAAATTQHSIVTPLCDSCLYPFEYKSGTIGGILAGQIATQTPLVHFEADTNWIIGRRTYTEKNINSWILIPRSLLRMIYGSLAQMRVPTLEEIGPPTCHWTDFDASYYSSVFTLCWPSYNCGCFETEFSRSRVRFWLALNAEQRNTMLSGKQLPLSSLSPDQQQAFEEFVRPAQPGTPPEYMDYLLPKPEQMAEAALKAQYHDDFKYLGVIQKAQDNDDIDMWIPQPISDSDLRYYASAKEYRVAVFQGIGWELSLSLERQKSPYFTCVLYSTLRRLKDKLDLMYPDEKLKKVLEEGKKASDGGD